MAPMKTLNSKYSSSNYGEDIARQANVLASCYVVDAAGSLKGLHYCTTLAAGKIHSLHNLLPPLLAARVQALTSLTGAEWYS